MRKLFIGCTLSIVKIIIRLLHLYVNPVNHFWITAFSKPNIVNGKNKGVYVHLAMFIALKQVKELKLERL